MPLSHSPYVDQSHVDQSHFGQSHSHPLNFIRPIELLPQSKNAEAQLLETPTRPAQKTIPLARNGFTKTFRGFFKHFGGTN